MVRSLVVDVTPLRTSRPFRWLYVGQVGGSLASQLLVVAVPYQVFVETGSTLLVGMVGLAQLGPLLVFGLLGGTLADAFDRRRVLAVVQVLMALTCVGLALNTAGGPALWPIYVLVALNAGISGIESPTRTAMVPALVGRSQLASAFALNLTLNELVRVVGPASAGLLIAGVGIAPTYWLAAFAGVAGALALVPIGPQRPEGATGRVSLGAAVDGWRYVRDQPLLRQTMLVDLSAMVFGMPRALFPVLGTVVLGGDAATVGLLYAAPGAGAMLGAFTTGWVGAIRRQGRAVLVAISVWGLSIVGLGLARHLWLALLLLAVGGGADVVSNLFRNALLQLAVPDGLRGRVTAFKDSLAAGGPQLGDARAGSVASVTSPGVSLVSGGLLCLAGVGLLVWRGRSLWDQHVDDDPDARSATVAG